MLQFLTKAITYHSNQVESLVCNRPLTQATSIIIPYRFVIIIVGTVELHVVVWCGSYQLLLLKYVDASILYFWRPKVQVCLLFVTSNVKMHASKLCNI